MLRLPALYSAISRSIRSTSSCRVGFLRAAATLRSRRSDREALCLGALSSGESRRESVEVDLAEVDERVGVDALGGCADHVLLGSDRAVEESVDGVGHVGDVGPLAASEVEDALRQDADDGHGRLVGWPRPDPGAPP